MVLSYSDVLGTIFNSLFPNKSENPTVRALTRGSRGGTISSDVWSHLDIANEINGSSVPLARVCRQHTKTKNAPHLTRMHHQAGTSTGVFVEGLSCVILKRRTIVEDVLKSKAKTKEAPLLKSENPRSALRTKDYTPNI